MRVILKNLRSAYKLEFLEIILACVAVVTTDATFESLVIGGVIAIAGVVLSTWTSGYDLKEGDGHLTFGGPYRYLRYPAVLSRFLVVIGLILVARRPILYIAAIFALTPLYRQFIRRNDAWMREELGPVAGEYRAIVSGLIPQLLPAKMPGFRQTRPVVSFSWSRALWQRPRRAGITLAVVGAALMMQYIWTQRLLLEWHWRLGAFSTATLLLILAARDYQRHQLVGDR